MRGMETRSAPLNRFFTIAASRVPLACLDLIESLLGRKKLGPEQKAFIERGSSALTSLAARCPKGSGRGIC
jgi:hypothetical protein